MTQNKSQAGKQNLGAQVFVHRESPEARQRLEDLRLCLQRHEESYWNIGDHLIALVGIRDLHGNKKGGMGFTLKELAKRFAYKPARLCQIYKTALAFKPNERLGASFYDHELARKAVRSFPQVAKDLVTTVKELSRSKIIDPRTNRPRAIRTIRDLSQFYAQKRARLETAATIRTASIVVAKKGKLIDQCHPQKFQDVIPALVSAGVTFGLVFADPPYVYPEENVYRGQSVARTDCDARTRDEAITVTLDLLTVSDSLLAPGGCLLLCQPAGPLLLEFQEVLRDHGLCVHAELIWDKKAPKPGSFDTPYTTSTERIWVLARMGEQLRNHDLSSRADILVERPVEHDPGDPHLTHVFQKPQSLCRRLLLKHTYPGGLILEPFGCSGEMCVAAVQQGRHFVYCESNSANFTWGAGRIRATLKSSRRTAV